MEMTYAKSIQFKPVLLSQFCFSHILVLVGQHFNSEVLLPACVEHSGHQNYIILAIRPVSQQG